MILPPLAEQALGALAGLVLVLAKAVGAGNLTMLAADVNLGQKRIYGQNGSVRKPDLVHAAFQPRNDINAVNVDILERLLGPDLKESLGAPVEVHGHGFRPYGQRAEAVRPEVAVLHQGLHLDVASSRGPLVEAVHGHRRGQVELLKAAKGLEKTCGRRQGTSHVLFHAGRSQKDLYGRQLVACPLLVAGPDYRSQSVLDLVTVMVVLPRRCQGDDKCLVPIVRAELHLARGQIDGQAPHAAGGAAVLVVHQAEVELDLYAAFLRESAAKMRARGQHGGLEGDFLNLLARLDANGAR